MVDVSLVVGGKIYAAWKTVRISQRLDALCASFTLSTHDDFPIRVMAESPGCVITIGTDTVMTGYLEKGRRSELDGDFEVSGRDKTCDLVDCSVLPKEYHQQSPRDLAQKLVEPFGITVNPPLLPFATIDLWRTEPGETVFQALERLCRRFGVLMRSNALGQLIIEAVGSTRSETKLVQGENIIDASVAINKDQLYSEYTVAREGDNWLNPGVTVTVKDEEVRRARPLRVEAEGVTKPDEAKMRAAWERAVRRGRSLTVTVKTQGWRRPSGRLWQVNEVVSVDIPRLGLKHDLLVSGVEFSFGEDGTLTSLELTYPDAFQPRPGDQRKKAGILDW